MSWKTGGKKGVRIYRKSKIDEPVSTTTPTHGGGGSRFTDSLAPRKQPRSNGSSLFRAQAPQKFDFSSYDQDRPLQYYEPNNDLQKRDGSFEKHVSLRHPLESSNTQTQKRSFAELLREHKLEKENSRSNSHHTEQEIFFMQNFKTKEYPEAPKITAFPETSTKKIRKEWDNM
jgi:hypothetical protein